MYGLTMIKDYLDELLDGIKTYDVRSYPTSKRGTIALVDSRTMKVYGVIDLISVRRITLEEYAKWHCTGRFKNATFIAENLKEYYAYDFINPRRLVNPIKLNISKKTWVKIKDSQVNAFYVESSLF